MKNIFIFILCTMALTLIGCDNDSGTDPVEICNNSIDDNENGLVDCLDPACSGHQECQLVEICNNGLDDDENGTTDCEDPACNEHASCVIGEDCSASGDEDSDGFADCADPECDGLTGPQGFECESSESICDDFNDNDGDGLTDCDDPDCSGSVFCSVSGTIFIDFSFPTVERSRGLYIWIEDSEGNYIDTIQQYFGRGDDPNMRYNVLGFRFPNDLPVEWQEACGETDTLVLDGVTTATPGGLNFSGMYRSETWDCMDRSGNLIPRGLYTVKVEVTFDGTGHPILPVYYYEGTIDLTGGDSVSSLSPSDEKVTSAQVTFTAQ
ncbi:DUF2271 domain-containing protein [Myxococcota bacterium]|nr:DUF2271 domain-containing protein [Myxococcota bacterium]MBU1380729.1 DUF2271 domain-containing protein [Myxococcota bacterium]MBU1498043.1 DUF2271 domain-containing protein [Myxococcota bacterium]